MARSIIMELRRGRWRRQSRFLSATLLVAPLAILTALGLVLPLVLVLYQAVSNSELVEAMPRSAMPLRELEVGAMPSPSTVATVCAELAKSYGSESLGRLAKRLNAERGDARSIIMGTARKLSSAPQDSVEHNLSALTAVDKAWATPQFWDLLRRAALPLTDHYLLAAIDLTRDGHDHIAPVETGTAIYRDAAVRTLVISMMVTASCFMFGFPFAFLLVHARGWLRTLLLASLMLPFWTSLLVRTTAWIVLLQNEGVVNKMLISSGVLHSPLPLIRNRAGVIIAMTHVLLPFMVLPLMSIMRNVRADLLRASSACGAKPLQTFVRVYWPLIVPGIAAGGLLVFIQSIGYFITPALIGGPKDQMLGYFVALHTNETLDWGMASALAAVLIAAVLVLYSLWRKVAPADGGLA